MPSILSRLRGLRAPVALDEPLRKGDGGGAGGASPLTTKGDLWGFDTVDDRLPVGSNGLVLTADSTAPLGVSYTAKSPLTTKGDIYVGGASAPTRLAVGTDTYVLTADSSAPSGLAWDAPGGGSASPFNVTPDTHPGTPTGVGLGPNEEFEGGALDTTGARYSGATPWTWVNQSTSTIALAQGSARLVGTINDFNIRGIFQPTPNLTAWRYRMKFRLIYGASGQVNGGFMCGETSSGKYMGAGEITNGIGTNYFWMPYWTNLTTFNNYANLTGPIGTGIYDQIEASWGQFAMFYHELELSGGNTLTYRISRNGEDGSFVPVGSLALSGAGSIAQLDTIGIYVDGQAAGSAPTVVVDWFRRMA